LRNFKKVDDQVYRGAQPTEPGFAALAKLGIHTVLDLRDEGGRSSREGIIVRKLGMQYVNIHLAGYVAPTAEQISKTLALLEDPKRAPVFIHCRRGADRTGTIIALYRIEHDHWTNDQALKEAKEMRMASRERLMQALIMKFKPVVPVTTTQ
jgi:protein tyrosine/serine phosphatase